MDAVKAIGEIEEAVVVPVIGHAGGTTVRLVRPGDMGSWINRGDHE